MKTFREYYCERYGCPPDRFEQDMLQRCLYGHARVAAPLLRKLNRRYFAPDLELIHTVGLATTKRKVREAIDDYFHHFSNVGWLRRRFRFRLSTNAVRQIAREFFGSADA